MTFGLTNSEEWGVSEDGHDFDLLDQGIVLVHDDDRIFAKLISQNGTQATIEFFHSVAERTRETIDVQRISRMELQKQTRVFVETTPGYWRVGRVLSHLNEDNSATFYEVRFPNKIEQEISETEIYVRCLDHYADPSENLAAGCAESQGLADRRRVALRTLRSLRSACEGLTGPYSAAIELMPHQISTVRRVLQDSLVRYLLADEVGLGKTIEAGAIIRQMLLDRHDLQVLILVPESLVAQWKNELQKRFYIDTASTSVSILAYESFSGVPNRPDLLVIDEAHRVIATGEEYEDASVASGIEILAHSVESLLLLSATPALGDEERLFGLLHLLDPSAYPKTDIEGFKRKVRSRQEIGRLLIPMQPGGNPFVVKKQAESAQSLFPNDPYVQSLAMEIIHSESDEGERDRAVTLMRDHIARTYRIHDRLLRSRRVDAEEWAMHPRGAPYPALDHVRMIFENSSWVTELHEALESWRSVATSATVESRGKLVERWRELVTSTFYSRSAVARGVKKMEPLFEGESDYLGAIIDTANFAFDLEARSEALLDGLLSWRSEQNDGANQRVRKIVVFVSDPEDAQETYEFLRKKFGSFDVRNIIDTSDDKNRSDTISAFESDPQSWILIASHDAEEGLNLQFVDAILHLDLPTDVARLEQRIGRLDRFGRKIRRLEHRLFLPNDDEDAPWYAWTDILLNGFQIFNGSASDIQFKLQDLEQLIWSQMFEEGPSCSEDISASVLKIILEEREKINEQQTLDQIANLSVDALPLIEKMEEAEADEEELDTAVSGWMHGVLQLNQFPPKPRPKETHRVFWEKPLLPLIPWERVFEASLDTPLTWRRDLAQSAKENPVLLRPGAHLLNALDRLANWDDRGSAYATWRVDPSVEDMWVGIRWVWILSPRLSSEAAVWKDVERPDLQRRTEQYLPILTVDQWTDFQGDVVNDASLNRRLSMPYQKKMTDRGYRDINIGSRPEAFAEIIDPIVFRETLKGMRRHAMENVWRDADVVSGIERAKDRFEREDALIRQSLERRKAYLSHEFGQNLDGEEEAIADLEAIGEAIRNPVLRLDECGLMVLSNTAPNALGN